MTEYIINYKKKKEIEKKKLLFITLTNKKFSCGGPILTSRHETRNMLMLLGSQDDMSVVIFYTFLQMLKLSNSICVFLFYCYVRLLFLFSRKKTFFFTLSFFFFCRNYFWFCCTALCPLCLSRSLSVFISSLFVPGHSEAYFLMLRKVKLCNFGSVSQSCFLFIFTILQLIISPSKRKHMERQLKPHRIFFYYYIITC